MYFPQSLLLVVICVCTSIGKITTKEESDGSATVRPKTGGLMSTLFLTPTKSSTIQEDIRTKYKLKNHPKLLLNGETTLFPTFTNTPPTKSSTIQEDIETKYKLENHPKITPLQRGELRSKSNNRQQKVKSREEKLRMFWHVLGTIIIGAGSITTVGMAIQFRIFRFCRKRRPERDVEKGEVEAEPEIESARRSWSTSTIYDMNESRETSAARSTADKMSIRETVSVENEMQSSPFERQPSSTELSLPSVESSPIAADRPASGVAKQSRPADKPPAGAHRRVHQSQPNIRLGLMTPVEEWRPRSMINNYVNSPEVSPAKSSNSLAIFYTHHRPTPSLYTQEGSRETSPICWVDDVTCIN